MSKTDSLIGHRYSSFRLYFAAHTLAIANISLHKSYPSLIKKIEMRNFINDKGEKESENITHPLERG